MTEEKPVLNWLPLIDLYCEIHEIKKCDFRTVKKFYVSLGVLRKINGHPAVFRSEVFRAMKSNKTLIKTM